MKLKGAGRVVPRRRATPVEIVPQSPPPQSSSKLRDLDEEDEENQPPLGGASSCFICGVKLWRGTALPAHIGPHERHSKLLSVSKTVTDHSYILVNDILR